MVTNLRGVSEWWCRNSKSKFSANTHAHMCTYIYRHMCAIGSVFHSPDRPCRKPAGNMSSNIPSRSSGVGFPRRRVKSESLRIKLSNSSEPKAARNTLYVCALFVRPEHVYKSRTRAQTHTHTNSRGTFAALARRHKSGTCTRSCCESPTKLVTRGLREEITFLACNTQDEAPNFTV